MVKNIFWNILGKISSIVLLYFFTPQYIKILGMESYGLINFYAVLLSILFFADAGLSVAINREMSRSENITYLSTLLFSVERLYIFICLGIVVLMTILSKIISVRWFSIHSIPSSGIQSSIILMSICIAFQLLIMLYNSCLMGLQRQKLANIIQIFYNISKFGLVFFVLSFFPNVNAYFIWQILISILFVFIIRLQTWKFLTNDISGSWNFEILKGVGGFAIGMAIMAVTSSIGIQIDKIFVSKVMSLKEFGYYSLSAIVGQIPGLIISPITLAILPRLTQLISLDKLKLVRSLYFNVSFCLSSIIFTIVIILHLFMHELLFFWTGNEDLVYKIITPARILIWAGMFMSLQFMPYYLGIANGNTRIAIITSITNIVIQIPLLFFLVPKYGLVGAAIPSLVVAFISFIMMGLFTTKKYIKKSFGNWVLSSVVLPGCSGIVILGVFYIKKVAVSGIISVLSCAFILCILILFSNIFIFLKVNFGHYNSFRLKQKWRQIKSFYLL